MWLLSLRTANILPQCVIFFEYEYFNYARVCMMGANGDLRYYNKTVLPFKTIRIPQRIIHRVLLI